MENTKYNIEPLNNSISTENSTEKNLSSNNYIPFISKVSNDDSIKKLIEIIHDENKTQYGWLSCFFGTEKNASKNITFTLLLIIVIVFCILIFWVNESNEKSQTFVINLFEKIVPLITLAFGYLFGKQ